MGVRIMEAFAPVARSDDVQGNGEVYEALSTMAACFLRADSTAICDCIKAFGLNDLLWDLTQSVGAFRDGKRFREPPIVIAMAAMSSWSSCQSSNTKLCEQVARLFGTGASCPHACAHRVPSAMDTLSCWPAWLRLQPGDRLCSAACRWDANGRVRGLQDRRAEG